MKDASTIHRSDTACSVHWGLWSTGLAKSGPLPNSRTFVATLCDKMEKQHGSWHRPLPGCGA
eukprot:1988506-Amphidinium_carterae.1